MPGILLTLLLTLQLFISGFSLPSETPVLPEQPQACPVWWGMLDPELSLWFARIPEKTGMDETNHWDWSWHGFWSALFHPALIKEADNASSV